MSFRFSYYPPYGSALPGLQYNYADDGDTSKYRFGFNTQEADEEIAGEGNIYTAEFWEYDARLGRRFNTDPVFKEYESVYACLGNNPIWIIDINGADSTLYISVDKNVTIDKSKFEIQLKKSLKRAGLEFLKIKFTEIEDVDNLKNFDSGNDQFIRIAKVENRDDYRGATLKTKSENYYSFINFNAHLENGVINYRFIGRTIAHETTHSFINRIFDFLVLDKRLYGFSSESAFDEGGGHINNTDNLLMSGNKLNMKLKLTENLATHKGERNNIGVYHLIHKYLVVRKPN
jgi:hypothetical protein